MLNFALPFIPKAGNNVPSIHPALKAPILIRNHALASEVSEAKQFACRYLPCRLSYEHFRWVKLRKIYNDLTVSEL